MAGRLGKANIAGNDGLKDFITEELPQIGGNLPRQIRAVVEHGEQNSFDSSGCPNESRIRSMVSISSEMPSRAKNSHWIGTSTESAAIRAFRVNRSSAGGQSIRMNWYLFANGAELLTQD